MHDDDSPRRELAPHEADDRIRRGSWGSSYPSTRSSSRSRSWSAEMVPEEDRHRVRRLIERGVRELVGIGLLHRSGDTIRPTRAALRFNHLFFDRDDG